MSHDSFRSTRFTDGSVLDVSHDSSRLSCFMRGSVLEVSHQFPRSLICSLMSSLVTSVLLSHVSLSSEA